MNGVKLAYQVSGPADGPSVLLLPGIGMQLIEWPPEIVEGLVKHGFRVITYEHRDTGASTHFTSAGIPDFAKLFEALAARQAPPLPYTAQDMRDDAVGLLEQLGVENADLVGVSGGATIGSLVALSRPDLVRSLTLIAANSGNPAVAVPANPERLAKLPQPRAGESHSETVERRIATYRALAGPASFSEKRARSLMEMAVARDNDPFGTARQGAALLALGDMRGQLSGVRVPTLVIHGQEDPLIAHQLGREVAEAIPDSKFVLIAGMGHEVSRQLTDLIVKAVAMDAPHKSKPKTKS